MTDAYGPVTEITWLWAGLAAYAMATFVAIKVEYKRKQLDDAQGFNEAVLQAAFTF